MMAEYVKAHNRKDLEGALEIYSDDFKYLGPDMTIVGKTALVDMIKESFKSDFTYKMDVLYVDVSSSGDMAYTHARNTHVIHGEEGDTVNVGKALAVYRKEDGKWRTVSLCTNSEPSTITRLN